MPGRVYSLTTVNLVITNPTYGQITIGGGGKLVGQLSYNYNANIFDMEGSPDGGYVVNFQRNKTGQIQVSVNQTSPHIRELNEFAQWCSANPELSDSNMKITDSLGNIALSANGVYIQQIAPNQIGATASQRQYTFLAGEINVEEGR